MSISVMTFWQKKLTLKSDLTFHIGENQSRMSSAFFLALNRMLQKNEYSKFFFEVFRVAVSPAST